MRMAWLPAATLALALFWSGQLEAAAPSQSNRPAANGGVLVDSSQPNSSAPPQAGTGLRYDSRQRTYTAAPILDGSGVLYDPGINGCALEEVRLVATLTGSSRPRAMFVNDRGTAFFVSVGDKLGRWTPVRVRRISENEVELQEVISPPDRERRRIIKRLINSDALPRDNVRRSGK